MRRALMSLLVLLVSAGAVSPRPVEWMEYDSPKKGNMTLDTLKGSSLRTISMCPGPQQDKEVTVFYESLCPDSVEFFSEHKGLIASFNDNSLNSQYGFNLVPFGNEKLNVSGKTTFGGRKCQHGDVECYGNAWQTCAVVAMGKHRAMAHIACLMDLPKTGMPDDYSSNHDWTCGTHPNVLGDHPNMYVECVVDQCKDSITRQEMANVQTCAGGIQHNLECDDNDHISCQGLMAAGSHQAATTDCGVKHVPWVMIDGHHDHLEMQLDNNDAHLIDVLRSQALTLAQRADVKIRSQPNVIDDIGKPPAAALAAQTTPKPTQAEVDITKADKELADLEKHAALLSSSDEAQREHSQTRTDTLMQQQQKDRLAYKETVQHSSALMQRESRTLSVDPRGRAAGK